MPIILPLYEFCFPTDEKVRKFPSNSVVNVTTEVRAKKMIRFNLSRRIELGEKDWDFYFTGRVVVTLAY